MYRYKYKYKYHDHLPHPTPLLQSRGLMQSEQLRLHQQKIPEGAKFLINVQSAKEGTCDNVFKICPHCKRSSDPNNFKIDVSQIEGAYSLWFNIIGNSGIRFTICRVKPKDFDEQVISNIGQGDKRDPIVNMNDLYISDPRGATGDFSVNIYAVPK
jgi:hypothetical protein